MRILKKVRAWRATRQGSFADADVAATLEARVGAAEYEFNAISRDVLAVMLDRPQQRYNRSSL
jgi:hypothetical protein